MSEPFLAFVPFLALVTRIWGGSEHDDSRVLEAEKPETGGRVDEANTRHSRWSYLHCNHIGILRWIIPDNRPNCSDSWTVFCYFHDRKCDYEENKDECGVYCSWQGFVRNWHNLSNSLNNTDRYWSWHIISRLGYWSLVRSIFRGVHPWHKMPVGSKYNSKFLST